jgi:hypothetical protein
MGKGRSRRRIADHRLRKQAGKIPGSMKFIGPIETRDHNGADAWKLSHVVAA